MKAINVLYAVDEDLGLQELSTASPSLCSIDDLSATYHLSLYYQHKFIIINNVLSFFPLFSCKIQKRC